MNKFSKGWLSRKLVFHKENYLNNLQYDVPAGLVIFLVAIPLCLGIALASGAPMMSGILAAISGALIVPIFSKSQLSVTGPAAGLTAIVLSGIDSVGSFEIFLFSVIIGGVIQVLLSFVKAGYIAYFFPNSVIKGMLSAIGIILILKQLPIAVGYNQEFFRSDKFLSSEGMDTFYLFFDALGEIKWGAAFISIISLFVLISWDRSKILSKIHWLPGALVVVCLGVLINYLFALYIPEWAQSSHNTAKFTQLVNIPDKDFHEVFTLPHWSGIFDDWDLIKRVLITGVTIGLVASVESLLTVEAVDKLDPYKRKTPLNRELLAQGIGNIFSGLIGGLPVTSVIVRSSAGINAGAKTKVSTIVNGFLTLISIIFLIPVINMIPTASLAVILIIVGFKLARPRVFTEMYHKRQDQFIPFVVTILAILLSNLLLGIIIGIVVGIFFIVRTNFHTPIVVVKYGDAIRIKFTKDITFLNKAILGETLERVAEGSKLVIDGSEANFIDQDVVDLIEEFKKECELKSIQVQFIGMHRVRFSKNPFLFSLRDDQ